MVRDMEQMNNSKAGAMGQVLGNIILAAEKASPKEETDEVVDGLRYCSKCHTPKEKRIVLLGSETVVPVMCRCKSEEVRKKKEADEARKRKERHDELRDLAFGRHGNHKKDPHSWTFENDNGEHERLMAVAKAYVDNWDLMKEEGRGLLIHSETTGTGKSYAAAAIVNGLVDQGVRCLFTNITKIYSEAGATWEGQSSYYNDLFTYQLLVIDDFGTERCTEAMMEAVFRVINERYNLRQPLIVTTNLNGKDLANGDGPYARVMSRLYEMCIPVKAEGSDVRRKIMREQKEKFGKVLGLD